MILFKKHSTTGRLGNQLFTLASILGMSRKFNCEYLIPNWSYSKYFIYPINQCEEHPNIDLEVTEPNFHYEDEFWSEHENDFKNKNVNVQGWLQSEMFWNCDKKFIQELFSFKHEFYNDVKNKFIDAFNKPTIAISIRRGDFIDNPEIFLLPIEYYIGALYTYFSYYENYNIIIFSDDLSYCKVHFKCLNNVFFADGLNDIEQLCLMSMCDNFIIANSTFSWWGAYLGEKSYSKVIRPAHHFAGHQLENCNIKNHYPNRWIIYDHLDSEINKIDLHDVTFCIPVFYDHPDRNSNLLLNICMLQKLFKADILIGEMGGEHWKDLGGTSINYMSFPEIKNFHRTKMLNEMFYSVKTPIIFNWDADVVVPPLQVLKAIELLRNDKVDMIYPYDGRFARVPRNLFSTIEHHLDIGCLGGIIFKGMRSFDGKSVGGAMAWKKEVFMNGGGENENYISYGNEDVERCYRFKKLGYRVDNVNGVLYHLDHFIGKDSAEGHEFSKRNWEEWYKIEKMSKEELFEYIKSWDWYKKFKNEF